MDRDSLRIDGESLELDLSQTLCTQENFHQRYIWTFELIEDPNNPWLYYDGPY